MHFLFLKKPKQTIVYLESIEKIWNCTVFIRASIPVNDRHETRNENCTFQESLNRICKISKQKKRLRPRTPVLQKLILSVYAGKNPKLVAVFGKAVSTDSVLTSQATAKQCFKTKERLLESAKRDVIFCHYNSRFMKRKERTLVLGFSLALWIRHIPY